MQAEGQVECIALSDTVSHAVSSALSCTLSNAVVHPTLHSCMSPSIQSTVYSTFYIILNSMSTESTYCMHAFDQLYNSLEEEYKCIIITQF